jgi:hypothetical protein
MMGFLCKNVPCTRGESTLSGPPRRRLTLRGRMPLSQVRYDLRISAGGNPFNPDIMEHSGVHSHPPARIPVGIDSSGLSPPIVLAVDRVKWSFHGPLVPHSIRSAPVEPP